MNKNPENKYCSIIAVLGRPNSGKSTLFNSVVGTKLSAVSRKRHTTRNTLQGVLTESNHQLIFVDSPGLTRKSEQKSQLSSLMSRQAKLASLQADTICYLVSIDTGLTDFDRHYLHQLSKNIDLPILLLLSKSDRKKKKQIAETVSEIKNDIEKTLPNNIKIRPFSAKNKDMVLELLADLKETSAPGEWLFQKDTLTDQTPSFIASERIREQLIRRLGCELPQTTAVKIEAMKETPKGLHVSALIAVNRKSHKPIVVGKGGQSIKAIGESARLSLEKHYDRPVHLKLWVKIVPEWINEKTDILELQNLISNITT